MVVSCFMQPTSFLTMGPMSYLNQLSKEEGEVREAVGYETQEHGPIICPIVGWRCRLHEKCDTFAFVIKSSACSASMEK